MKLMRWGNHINRSAALWGFSLPIEFPYFAFIVAPLIIGFILAIAVRSGKPFALLFVDNIVISRVIVARIVRRRE
jgi:hypothetical protein